jgi:hypothetical protein
MSACVKRASLFQKVFNLRKKKFYRIATRPPPRPISAATLHYPDQGILTEREEGTVHLTSVH